MENRFYLVNAPAGSGKTTFIYNKILELSIINPRIKLLCITYTNRAAYELLNRFKYYNSNNLEVYTIHSFLSKFIKDYFKKKEVIDFYFETNKDKIENILNFPDEKNNQKKIEKYKEKYGDRITLEDVRKNIELLYYNETNFDSYLYGGLSHDSLIKFIYMLSEKYKAIQFKLAYMFDYIFIDEYQDTPSNVLKLFYNSLQLSKTTLYLFGDKMQQIYDKYDYSFNEIAETFNKSITLNNNYRSSKKIVDILNNLYYDKKLQQNPCSEIMSFNSNVLCIFTNDYEKVLSKYNNYYKLFLLNKKKYEQIGAIDLYNSIYSIEQYSYNGKYNVNDALDNNLEENKDILFRPLYIIRSIVEYNIKNDLGSIVRIIDKYKKIINFEIDKIIKFDDIYNLKEMISSLENEFNNNENTLIDLLTKTKFLRKEYFDFLISNEEYEKVLNIKIIEFKKYSNYLENSDCSTQHGVKGEGHDNIVFVSDSSNNPNVQMYEFFEYFSKKNINIDMFEMFNQSYIKYLLMIENLICMKINDLDSNAFKNYENKIDEILCDLYDDLSSNELFEILSLKYETYMNNKNVTNLKKLLKKRNILGILTAYKIFYVGCSRAKKNLVVIINKDMTKSFHEKLAKKMSDIGFEIINE